MAKKYKLENMLNSEEPIRHFNKYSELKEFLDSQGIGKTQVCDSEHTRKPTKKGWLLTSVENNEYEVTCGLCGKHMTEDEVAGRHEGEPQCSECWSKWHSEEYIKSDNVLKEGKVERKPKFIKENDNYTVYYGNNKKVTISEEELSKFRKYYCGKHSFTIEEMCLEFNMIRQEIYAIKTAFDIVKQSIIFTDKEIDEHSIDELADLGRIEKKKAYFRKLEELKVKDMEEEIKKLHKKDYYLNKIIDKMKDIKIYDTPFTKNNKNNSTMIVSLADLHVGAFVDNILNKYNIDVFKNRMKEFKNKVINEIIYWNVEKVIIQNLGDSINGNINMANRIESDCGLVDSVAIATQEIANFIKDISEVSTVEYYQVYGNHSNMFKDKTFNIEEENMERFITWGLQNIFSESVRVKIHSAEDVIGYNLYDELICLQHGHQQISIEKLTDKFKRVPRFMYCGHMHNFKITTKGNCEEIQVGCMLGVDSYAFSKGFTGRPSQLISIVSSDWENVSHIPVYFK